MRNETEMYNLILDIAKKDERIRAVYMNGSKTNPNVPKDIFQDYDIVYVVTETESFIKEQHWIDIFGERLMLQEPDKLDQGIGMERDFSQSYTYLMLFTDGNRLDLHIETIESMRKSYGTDSLTLPLLDKENCLPAIPPATDRDYYVKRPTAGDFDSCTNNFWWCSQNVAKGLWRDELSYAQLMFIYTIRDALDKMVSWWIGMQHNFELSAGKLGKYFKNYLPEHFWRMYEQTYADSNSDNMWEAMFKACELFRILAQDVANHCNFIYPLEDDRNMTRYLQQVKELSKDAARIF